MNNNFPAAVGTVPFLPPPGWRQWGVRLRRRASASCHARLKEMSNRSNSRRERPVNDCSTDDDVVVKMRCNMIRGFRDPLKNSFFEVRFIAGQVYWVKSRIAIYFLPCQVLRSHIANPHSDSLIRMSQPSDLGQSLLNEGNEGTRPKINIPSAIRQAHDLGTYMLAISSFINLYVL